VIISLGVELDIPTGLDDGSAKISLDQVRHDGTGTILECFLMMWAFPRT
jgi:hypothetical protein